ncbi:MAG: hypothetical protein CMH18_11470 [Methylophaga sp.]|uniref:hypothetical protein n=1 Tax=Methylophaga sp. TaxID=2024840 RepID=UPI000C911FFF|nr:hypothetical protein [Methylophaga sp.]MAL50369.1 hypothetical protein [Methylophaga sp.]|tara:strand:+ start:1455 stop:3854 length:2400 start_codon:yes stop_codon:yes gene_type:complete
MSRYSTYGTLDDRVAQNADVGFSGFNNRLRPDQLNAGVLADAQNFRMDRNGSAQVRKGVDIVQAPLAVGVSALSLPFTLVADDTSVTATRTGTTVVLTGITATDFPSSGTVNISGVTMSSGPAVNGNRPYTKDSNTQITISDQTYAGSASGTATVKFGILADSSVNNIYGSMDFSDPNASSSQYIIIASNNKAVGIDIANEFTFDIGYPSVITIDGSVEMLQAFNKAFIFRGGSTALENNLRISTISSAVLDHTTNTVTITTSTNHNLSTNDLVTISSLGFDATKADPNGSAIDITRTGDTTFTYTLVASSADTFTVSSSSVVATDFTKVTSGAYTQPTELAATGFVITNGLATATVSNTLSAGDKVVLTVAGGSTLTKGDTFIVSEATSSLFKFFTNTADVANQTNVVFTQKVSVALGFVHMPAPPFAVYHQRRLFMPFQFLSTGTDTFESRNILDEVIGSEPLDTDTYDRFSSEFRFNAGTSDFVVGLSSFAEDRLLVFNRNSIHVIEGSSDLETSSQKLLTDEVGCVARKTIQQIGNQVIFLSDNGVYGTQFLDEYNLRGAETPLSEPIDSTIKRINKNAQSKAVAVYFDNRYFIAVPLDGSDANAENNAILVYNFLNKQWESIDTVANDNYHISNLLVLGDGDKRGVYAINNIGGVHRLDVRTDGIDQVVTQIGQADTPINIDASLTTRQYTLENLDRKRWKEFDIHAQSSDDNNSDFTINFETENPDATGSLGNLSNFNGGVLEATQDVSIRGRIGNQRGYGIQFTLNNTTGRPIIRAIEVQGATTMRSTDKAI